MLIMYNIRLPVKRSIDKLGIFTFNVVTSYSNEISTKIFMLQILRPKWVFGSYTIKDTLYSHDGRS